MPLPRRRRVAPPPPFRHPLRPLASALRRGSQIGAQRSGEHGSFARKLPRTALARLRGLLANPPWGALSARLAVSFPRSPSCAKVEPIQSSARAPPEQELAADRLRARTPRRHLQPLFASSLRPSPLLPPFALSSTARHERRREDQHRPLGEALHRARRVVVDFRPGGRASRRRQGPGAHLHQGRGGQAVCVAFSSKLQNKCRARG